MAIQGLGQRATNLFTDIADATTSQSGNGAGQPQHIDGSAYAQTLGAVGQAEIINSRNSPANFRAWRTRDGEVVPGGANFVESLAELPTDGKCKNRPWADTYWPTYQNSICHRWQSNPPGETEAERFLNGLSPAEKYDVIFNNWDPTAVKDFQPYDASYGGFDYKPDSRYYDNLGPVAKSVSARHGNKRTRDAAAKGYLNPDGTVNEKGEEAGVKDYGGIETWFGLCHAWVPAAILEDEPLKAVKVDTEWGTMQVEVSDMKAWAIACYQGSNSGFLGSRNNDKPDDVALEPNGRASDRAYRDVNPGAFHLCVTNRIGLQGRSMAEDRTAHYEVWNQPIQEYACEIENITREEAVELANDGDNDADYDYNPNASKFAKVSMSLDYITESHASTRPNAHHDGQERTDRYEYILEMDNSGNIIGGEWLGASKKDHPDFLWDPMEGGNRPLTRNMALSKVRDMIAQSREDVGNDGDLIDPVKTGSITLDAGETHSLDVIEVKKDGRLQFDLSGNGDMDVYIKKGEAPRISENGHDSNADEVMFETGSQQKTIFDVKAGDKVHVTMRGYEDSTANLNVTQLRD